MQIIDKYFPNLSEKQVIQFSQLKDLYTYWNNQINVISRKDIDFLYEHHVVYSLAIAKVICFKKGSSILDVGTGGGFPGLPLAIFFHDSSFFLIDSIGKKIKVVNSIVSQLKLINIKTQQIRAEKLKKRFDFVVGRGVTSFPDFVKLVSNNIHLRNQNQIQNGILYLKGGCFSDEIEPFKDHTVIYKIKDFFNEPFFETKKIIYLPLNPVGN